MSWPTAYQAARKESNSSGNVPIALSGDALHCPDIHSLDSAPPKNEATSPEGSEESSSGESDAWAAATAPEQTELVKKAASTFVMGNCDSGMPGFLGIKRKGLRGSRRGRKGKPLLGEEVGSAFLCENLCALCVEVEPS